VYGISKIFQSKRVFLKVFWLICFFLSIISSVYFIKRDIESYFKFEVVTQIRNIYKQPLPFPAVSICPQISGNFDSRSIKNVISDCSFNLDTNCNDYPNQYFEKYNTHLGPCYRFNSGKNLSGYPGFPILNSTIGGNDDSLIIKLINIKIGIQIWIHDQLSPPRFDYYNDHVGRIFISNASFSQIIIHKTVDEQLPLPYNPCYKNVNEFPYNKTIINYILNKINITYKQKICLELCYDIDYINRNPCNCTNTTLGNVWNDCWINYENKLTERFGCTYKDKREFFRSSIIEKCEQYCPLECDSVFYSNEVTSVPNEKREIHLRIYYENLQYTSITQIPKEEVFDLIASLGGSLGLFIGLSFMTVFEIGELLIESFFLLLERRKNLKIGLFTLLF